MSIIKDAQKARAILQTVTDATRENLKVPYIRALMIGLKKAGLTMEQYEELKKKDYLERSLSL